MAGSPKCIPQIRLSNGTIVNIPVFRYHTGFALESKMGGIYKVYKEQNGTRTEISNSALLTDAEFCELLSLISNHTFNNMIQGSSITTTLSYNIFEMFWYEDSSGDFYLLGTGSGTSSGSNIDISNAGRIFTDAPISDIQVRNTFTTYNDVGVTGDNYSTNNPPYETHSFAEMCSYREANPNAGLNHVVNISVSTGHIQIDGFYSGSEMTNTVIADGMVLSRRDYDAVYNNITTYATNNHLDIGINTYDSEDPYSFEAATFGGGNGSMGSFNPDGVDPAQIPPLPQLSASDIGFMSVYNPSSTQLKSLSAFLWSSAFDVDSFKKLFSDPMECIIGLSVVPVQPSIGGSKNVTFGDIDSGVSMSYIANEYVEKNMGSVSLDLLYDSFMDYQTTIQIYLPYIGFRQLDAADIIGGSISVTYHVNVLDGGCTAYIVHSERGVLYQYSGSCIANIPLSAINFSGALQNAISAALSGATVVAGAATGAAPVTAMGITGLATNAANLAVNSKPTVQRSGTVSGSSGLMAIQRPFVIIERANISVPENRNGYVGNTTNVTMTLSSCKGFTMVDSIHLDNVICTEGEREELYKLLKEGVIL